MEIPEQHIVGASLAHEEEKEPVPRHGSAMHLMNKTADMPGQPDGGDYANFKISKTHQS